MTIVGGLDIHRAQITFDCVDTETGRLYRGRIRDACRDQVRRWASQFEGRDALFAVEGCTGWRYVVEELEARRIGDEPLLAAALLQRGFVLHLVGDWAEARNVLEESLALSHRLDDRLAAARASHHLGFVAYFGYNDVALAWDLQCRCLALFRDVHNERHVVTALIAMVELARARGDRHAARNLATEAADHLRALQDTPLLIHALHHGAALAADEGGPPLALRLLGAAEGLQAATGAAPWPAVASGAKRWLTSAERSIGRRRAEALRAQARQLDADGALALLDSAAGGIPDPTELTRREQEVAALVAEGLTNRAIAMKLVLSERTVDGHVARALTKLGLRNRAQLAAYLAGRGCKNRYRKQVVSRVPTRHRIRTVDPQVRPTRQEVSRVAFARLALFPGGTEAQHRAIVDALGDAYDQAEGRVLFAAGPTGEGWQIVQVWETRDQCEQWVQANLGPAFSKVGSRGYPNPPRITDIELTDLAVTTAVH